MLNNKHKGIYPMQNVINECKCYENIQRVQIHYFNNYT